MVPREVLALIDVEGEGSDKVCELLLGGLCELIEVTVVVVSSDWLFAMTGTEIAVDGNRSQCESTQEHDTLEGKHRDDKNDGEWKVFEPVAVGVERNSEGLGQIDGSRGSGRSLSNCRRTCTR